MNPGILRRHLAAYASGLEAQLALLRQVHGLALDQRQASEARAAERLAEITTARGRLMTELDDIEREIQPSRQFLADALSEASRLEGFSAISALHRSADATVADILAVDQDTVQALTQTEAERRAAAHEIDAGETTLAAYRRVIAPPGTRPSLIDRQG